MNDDHIDTDAAPQWRNTENLWESYNTFYSFFVVDETFFQMWNESD